MHIGLHILDRKYHGLPHVAVWILVYVATQIPSLEQVHLSQCVRGVLPMSQPSLMFLIGSW